MYSPSALRNASKPLSGRLASGHGIPLGSADGAEQDGVGGPASRERFGGERFARRVDGASAERELGEAELVAEFRGAFLQHAHGGPHDFRADAVARQENDFLFEWSWFCRGPMPNLSRSLAVAQAKLRQPKAKQYSPDRSSCQCDGGRDSRWFDARFPSSGRREIRA